jgi:hypothetical protein
LVASIARIAIGQFAGSRRTAAAHRLGLGFQLANRGRQDMRGNCIVIARFLAILTADCGYRAARARPPGGLFAHIVLAAVLTVGIAAGRIGCAGVDRFGFAAARRSGRRLLPVIGGSIALIVLIAVIAVITIIAIQSLIAFVNIGGTLVIAVLLRVVFVPLFALAAIFFAARLCVGMDAEIMIDKLVIIFGLHPVAINLRILRQLFIFL